MPAFIGQPHRVPYAFVVSGTANKYGGISNSAPVWTYSPNVTFFTTLSSSFPFTGTYQSNNYVTDADNDTIAITKNNIFVQGVTWDGGKFSYNGTGSSSTVTGHILTANDGRGGVTDSSAFAIVIIPPAPSWIAAPSPNFVAGQTSTYGLSSLISNYNILTDVVSTVPGSPSLPSWLSITNSPAGLIANGSQVDANDLTGASRPNLRITRGSQTADSGVFEVTVSATNSGVATWTEMLQYQWALNLDGNTYQESSAGFAMYLYDNRVDDYAEWQAVVATAETPGAWTFLATPVFGGFSRFAVDEIRHTIGIIPG